MRTVWTMNFDFNNADLLSSNDVIRQLEPTAIPRVSAIAKIALCERAAYNISFFGMESNDFSANGEIGNAVHRITIKSALEIINLSKAGRPIHKESGVGIFEENARADIDTNWKRFLLAKVDKPFDLLMDDLYTRADRLLDKLIAEGKQAFGFQTRIHNSQYSFAVRGSTRLDQDQNSKSIKFVYQF
jgi:hypothetical protein